MTYTLEQLKELCEKATAGPWKYAECDMNFIEASRTAVPELIEQVEQGKQLHEADEAEIRKLRAQLVEAKWVIEFAAEHGHDPNSGQETTLSEKARAYLEKYK